MCLVLSLKAAGPPCQEVGGSGPCSFWVTDSNGHGQTQGRKGDTSWGPEGLGSLWQVRPQLLQPRLG